MGDPTCVVCGEDVKPKSPRGRQSKYCSGRCRDRAKATARAARHRATYVPRSERGASARYSRTCVICESSFESRTTRAIYCGPRCQDRGRHARRVASGRWAERNAAKRKHPSRACSGCGGPVAVRDNTAEHPRCRKCWSEEHDRSRSRRRRDRALNKIENAARGTSGKLGVLTSGTCLRCGARYCGLPSHTSAYCSTKCRRAVAHRPRKRPNIKPNRRRYVYERDGYRCHVCGGLTDPTAPWRLPRAPSLDHVVPWSEGGDDGPANLRCAHRGCNADRGVRGVSEQLWLFDPNHVVYLARVCPRAA